MYLHERWNGGNLVFCEFVSRGQELISVLQKRNPQTGRFASIFCYRISLAPTCSDSEVPSGVSPPT